MWQVFFATTFVALLWLAVVLIGVPIVWAVGGTLLAAAAVLVWVSVLRARSKGAAERIESALNADAEEQSRSARPGERLQMEELRGEFSDALRQLKSSQLGGGGARALYALPWYMIIGPPGCGKSTALRESGLSFPHVGANGKGVRGLGGTRNCDWWLGNEAVILDTAGRYATEDDDRAEWQSFLEMIKKNRPGKPINGLIVAVSVEELLGDRTCGADMEQLAAKLRERVDEVLQRLGMVLPVYLMVTKCDLLCGFVETFGGLSKRERRQLWGCTLPIEGQTPALQALPDHLDELSAALRPYVLARMEEERRIESRERMWALPGHLDEVLEAVKELSGHLFSGNVYQAGPLLRGVYFTSGTHEGRVLDRLTKTLGQAFGVDVAADSSVLRKSYFLHDAFVSVMIPDKDVASLMGQKGAMRWITRYGVTVGAAVAALLILILPLHAYRKNAGILETTRRIVQEVAADPQADATTIAPKDLVALRQRVQVLDAWKEGAEPLAMSFGMYQGDKVLPHVLELYVRTFQRRLLQHMVDDDARALQAFNEKYEYRDEVPTSREYARQFERLKRYLLLTASDHGERGTIDDETKDWLGRRIVLHWARRLNVTPGPAERDEMLQSVESYLGMLKDEPRLACWRDERLVARARRTLNRVPVDEGILKRVLAEADDAGHGLDVHGMVGAGGAASFESGTAAMRVRGAFTRNGWEAVVKDRLSGEVLRRDAWVLGGEGVESGGSAVRSRYLELYIEHWRDFLSGLRVKRADDGQRLSQAYRVARGLLRGTPRPYTRLAKAVQYNTTLGRRAGVGQAVEQAAEKAGWSDAVLRRIGDWVGGDSGANDSLEVDAAGGKGLTLESLQREFAEFVALGVAPGRPSDAGADAAAGGGQLFDIFYETLGGVRTAVQMCLDEGTLDACGAAQAAAGSAHAEMRGMVEDHPAASKWEGVMKALVLRPLEQLEGATQGAKNRDTAEDFTKALMEPLARLRRGYPFNRAGVDVPVADVAEFFRPSSGVVWSFFKERMSRDVRRAGKHFRCQGPGQGRWGCRRGVLDFLESAHAVTSALFPPGAEEPRVDFRVLVRPSRTFMPIVFDVGGQTAEYRGGRERWVSMQWPAPTGQPGARIVARGRGQTREELPGHGDWGLFRLLEGGTATAGSRADSFTMAWRGAAGSVEVSFKPARSESPFFGRGGRARTADLLRPFRHLGRVN